MDLRILEIASHTEKNKVLENYTHKTKHKNPLCGDEMEISLIVKDEVVKDMAYQCKSCVYCQASVSLLSRYSINKSLNKIENIIYIAKHFFDKKEMSFPNDWSDLNKIFDKKNISRKECLLLPFKTLSKALKL